MQTGPRAGRFSSHIRLREMAALCLMVGSQCFREIFTMCWIKKSRYSSNLPLSLVVCNTDSGNYVLGYLRGCHGECQALDTDGKVVRNANNIYSVREETLMGNDERATPKLILLRTILPTCSWNAALAARRTCTSRSNKAADTSRRATSRE